MREEQARLDAELARLEEIARLEQEQIDLIEEQRQITKSQKEEKKQRWSYIMEDGSEYDTLTEVLNAQEKEFGLPDS